MIVSQSLKQFFSVGLAMALMTVTGCKNGNILGKLHKAGDSSDVRSLRSDAQTAYRAGDYSRALEYYNRILVQDGNDSQALMGASASAMASAGLDLSTLLGNVLKQSSTASVSSMADVIRQSHVGGVVSAQGDLLSGVNRALLDQVIDLAMCRLQRIASGIADGTISPNDLNLLVNYGVLSLLRAVEKAEAKDLLSVINNAGTYSINSNLVAGICTGTTPISGFNTPEEQKAYLVNIAKDVAGAYAIYQRAVNNSNFGNNTVLTRLRDDLASVNQELLTVSSSIPQECINTFAAGGITVSNFTNYTGPFDPPTGC